VKLSTIIYLFLLAVFSVAATSAQWVQTHGPGGGATQCFAVSGTNLFAGSGYDSIPQRSMILNRRTGK
jgi:hypothetical protein